ncbi:MAG: cytochrome P450 [Coxiellaceae bacterium]|nr:cytochrome P450 [Coxiellaceae bacterium]
MTTSLFTLKKTLTPQQFSTALSDMGDIFWWQPGQFWCITSYEIAKILLTGSSTTCDRSPFFISRMPNIDLALLPDFFNVVKRMMVMRDNKLHQDSRRICYHGFGNKQITALRPKIEQIVDALLAQLPPSGEFDFCSQFADIIPMKTLADFFAIPESDRSTFVSHAKTMTAFFGGASEYRNEDAINVNHAAKELNAYFKDLYKTRKKNPQDDFFSDLIQQQKHFDLDEDDVIAQAIMMWVAGMVTTSDQMANNFYTLLNDFPAHTKQLQNDEQTINTIQECNRLDPAVTFTFRLACKDIKIQQHTIKNGQTIFISNHAINRDRRVYAQPHTITPSHSAKHFSFGMGSHFCIGAKLAMMEMHIAFQQLTRKYKKLSILESERLHYSLSFSGFSQIMTAYDSR